MVLHELLERGLCILALHERRGGRVRGSVKLSPQYLEVEGLGILVVEITVDVFVIYGGLLNRAACIRD